MPPLGGKAKKKRKNLFYQNCVFARDQKVGSAKKCVASPFSAVMHFHTFMQITQQKRNFPIFSLLHSPIFMAVPAAAAVHFLPSRHFILLLEFTAKISWGKGGHDGNQHSYFSFLPLFPH